MRSVHRLGQGFSVGGAETVFSGCSDIGEGCTHSAFKNWLQDQEASSAQATVGGAFLLPVRCQALVSIRGAAEVLAKDVFTE